MAYKTEWLIEYVTDVANTSCQIALQIFEILARWTDMIKGVYRKAAERNAAAKTSNAEIGTDILSRMRTNCRYGNSIIKTEQKSPTTMFFK